MNAAVDFGGALAGAGVTQLTILAAAPIAYGTYWLAHIVFDLLTSETGPMCRRIRRGAKLFAHIALFGLFMTATAHFIHEVHERDQMTCISTPLKFDAPLVPGYARNMIG